MSIAYGVEVILGALLVLSLTLLKRKDGVRWDAGRYVLRAGLEAFFEFVIYFAMSIEVAVIVLLVNKDFGNSTDGFGAADVQVALAVSVLCILPLLHPLSLLKGGAAGTRPDKSGGVQLGADPRVKLQLLLYSLLMALFLYPFVSQGIHNWAPSRVGEAKGENGETVVTGEEWAQVKRVCFGPSSSLRAWEVKLLAATEMAASIMVYLFACWQLLVAVTDKMQADEQEVPSSGTTEKNGILAQSARIRAALLHSAQSRSGGSAHTASRSSWHLAVRRIPPESCPKADA